MACVHEYSFSFHMPFSLFIYSEHGRINLYGHGAPEEV